MMIELKTNGGNAWVNPAHVSALDFQDSDRCYVRCDGLDYSCSHEAGRALLKALNGDAPQPTGQVRVIVSVEPASTYSKSTQAYFTFWRCELENGEKVNVFDHPDESRNTFQIAKQRGWETYLSDLVEGSTYTPYPAIACTVSHDGDWYALVDIIHHDLYETLDIDALQDLMDGIPWDFNAENDPDEDETESDTPDDIPFCSLPEATKNCDIVESALGSRKDNQHIDNGFDEESGES